MSQYKVLIAGAGIAGLSTALALAKQGHQVDLFEQAAKLTEVGAGLQLSPNAVRILHGLGLDDDLARCSFEPEAMQARHWSSGRLLTQGALGQAAIQRWGAPYLHIHRGDLQQLLLAHVCDQASIRLHLNATCKTVEQNPEQASLGLESGEQYNGDLLLGADGIHSVVREQLFGAEQARFTGHVAWRLLIDSKQLPENLLEPVAGLWMGPGAHFVHYYLRSGELVNCVAVVEQSEWRPESWTEAGNINELRSRFSSWHSTIRELLEAAGDGPCYRWGLFDRDPMPQWHQQRIGLLGDACHPTLPFLAQGAAMAIEDAAVLAACLAAGSDPPCALGAFQQQRQDRVARVQHSSRRNGRIYHLDGLPAMLRNAALSSGLASPLRTMDWLYDYRGPSPG